MLGGDRRGYTVVEAAQLLQYHPDAVRYWLRVSQLIGVRLNERDDWLISLEALVAFLRENGELAPEPLRLAS